MLTDIHTVFQKEWREIFQFHGIKSYLFNWILMVLLIGVYMPLQAGVEWLTSPLLLLLWSWPPLLLISGLVADAFAGEKERHTLETLLASRLPDTAILFGKFLTGWVYAGTLFPASLLLGLITVNLAHPSANGFLFYQPAFLAAILGIHFLMLLLISSIGMLLSMKSNTVRAAYQKMSGVILVFALVPSISIGLISPNLRAKFLQILTQNHLGVGTLEASLILILADALLLWLCVKNFKRVQILAA
jgi:ABC-2 type transport system permease protein